MLDFGKKRRLKAKKRHLKALHNERCKRYYHKHLSKKARRREELKRIRKVRTNRLEKIEKLLEQIIAENKKEKDDKTKYLL